MYCTAEMMTSPPSSTFAVSFVGTILGSSLRRSRAMGVTIFSSYGRNHLRHSQKMNFPCNGPVVKLVGTQGVCCSRDQSMAACLWPWGWQSPRIPTYNDYVYIFCSDNSLLPLCYISQYNFIIPTWWAYRLVCSTMIAITAEVKKSWNICSMGGSNNYIYMVDGLTLRHIFTL